MIVEHGADVNLKENSGLTPLGIARKKRTEKMVEIYLNLKEGIDQIVLTIWIRLALI